MERVSRDVALPVVGSALEEEKERGSKQTGMMIIMRNSTYPLCWSITSGAIQHGVPMNVRCLDQSCEPQHDADTPKSASRTCGGGSPSAPAVSQEARVRACGGSTAEWRRLTGSPQGSAVLTRSDSGECEERRETEGCCAPSRPCRGGCCPT